MKIKKILAASIACICTLGSVSYNIEKNPTISLNTVAADINDTVDK